MVERLKLNKNILDLLVRKRDMKTKVILFWSKQKLKKYKLMDHCTRMVLNYLINYVKLLL